MTAMAQMQAHDTAADRRLAARVAAEPPVRRNALRMVDVSRFGCQVEGRAMDDYYNGQFVGITFGQDLAASAIVRWSDDTHVGLEFARPLSSAHVAAALSAADQVVVRRL